MRHLVAKKLKSLLKIQTENNVSKNNRNIKLYKLNQQLHYFLQGVISFDYASMRKEKVWDRAYEVPA